MRERVVGRESPPTSPPPTASSGTASYDTILLTVVHTALLNFPRRALVGRESETVCVPARKQGARGAPMCSESNGQTHHILALYFRFSKNLWTWRELHSRPKVFLGYLYVACPIQNRQLGRKPVTATRLMLPKAARSSHCNDAHSLPVSENGARRIKRTEKCEHFQPWRNTEMELLLQLPVPFRSSRPCNAVSKSNSRRNLARPSFILTSTTLF